MQINATHGSASFLLSSAADRANQQSGFAAALDVAKHTCVGASTLANVAPTHKTAGEELAEYQSKSVARHIRDAILKELGLTEEQLDAMSPEQRAAVEEAITKKIQERLLAQGSGAQESAMSPASLLSLLVQQHSAVEQLSATDSVSPF